MDFNLIKSIRKNTIDFLQENHFALSREDKDNIEVTDFGLNEWPSIGLQLITFVNNERYCSKLLILLKNQNCPEHLHPPFANNIGKQETFKCLYGNVYLYVDVPVLNDFSPSVFPPKHRAKWYTAKKEIFLNAGEQFTIPPNTKHWFQAGDKGAIIAEYSSQSRDEFDIFTDPEVIRVSE